MSTLTRPRPDRRPRAVTPPVAVEPTEPTGPTARTPGRTSSSTPHPHAVHRAPAADRPTRLTRLSRWPAAGRVRDVLTRPVHRWTAPAQLRAPGTGPQAPSDLPVVLVLLLGEVPAETVSAAVDALVRVAVPRAGVRPVLVLDGPHLQIPRRAGLATDHVVSEASWTARHRTPYTEHLARSLRVLRADYCTRHVVRLADGVPDDDALLDQLRPPGRGRLARGAGRALSRLELAVDPA